MINKRRGITLLETTMMVGLVTFVAGLSINIVRLGNRNFEHVRDEAFQHRQSFQFAMMLRERAHRANRAIVSAAGDKLTLSMGEDRSTEFSYSEKGIEMLAREGGRVVAREQFVIQRDDGEWRFLVDDERGLIEVYGLFESRGSIESGAQTELVGGLPRDDAAQPLRADRGAIVAALGLLRDVSSGEGESNANEL